LDSFSGVAAAPAELQGPVGLLVNSAPSKLTDTLDSLRTRINGVFDGHTEDAKKVAAMASYICSANVSNYMLSNVQRLALVLLADGENWRAHEKQAFHYEEGAWLRVSTLSVRVRLKWMSRKCIALAMMLHSCPYVMRGVIAA
jgi:hypothetical protein